MRGPQRYLSLVLAVVLPALILSQAWFALQRPNVPTGKAAAYDRKLESATPDVLVLGSSLARTDVVPDLLAHDLGVDRSGVVMLTLPNATAAHWYAMLKNRVYANGHRPRLVIMVGALSTMITPDVLMESNVERLVNMLTDDEPVLGRKVLGTTSPFEFKLLYMKEQGGQMRTRFLSAIRDNMLLYFYSKKGKMGEARKLAERANEYVFADERMQYELFTGASTGMHVGYVEELKVGDLVISEDSLIPDIAELAHAFESEVVFVRTPFPPSNNDNDAVPPAMEDEAVELMSSVGAGYLDLRSLALDDSFFQDMRHMNPEGAAIFTAALARALREMRIFAGEGAAVVRSSRESEPATRLGRAPSLPTAPGEAVSSCAMRVPIPTLAELSDAALRSAGFLKARPSLVSTAEGERIPGAPGDVDTCTPGLSITDGVATVVVPEGSDPLAVQWGWDEAVPLPVEGETLPAWWVYPGTTLRFQMSKPWEGDPRDFQTFMLAQSFGGQDTAKILVDGESIDVSSFGQRAWATGVTTPPTVEGWTVEVDVPLDGPFLLLQNLAVGASPRTTHLVGMAESLSGGSIRVVGGKVEDTELDPVFSSAPPPIRVPPRVRKAPRGVGVISVNPYAALADASNSKAARPHACSPLRIYEDGELLDAHHSVCLEMATKKAGRSCHAGDLFYFAASDGSNPTTNGREYTLGLDPSRVCDRYNQNNLTPLRGALWLYPGDTVTLTFPPEQLSHFYDGANKLELELEGFGLEESDAIDAQLVANGEILLKDTIRTPGHKRGVVEWFLEPAVPPRARNVSLELHNPSARGFALVMMATLAEEYDYGFGAVPAEVQDRLDAQAAVKASAAEVGELWPPVDVRRLGEPGSHRYNVKTPRVVRDDVWEGHVFPLWPVSNSVLANKGLGWWSPVQVTMDGRPMKALRSRGEFNNACRGCFLHLGQSVVWNPFKGASSLVEVALHPEGLQFAPDGTPLHWTYPAGGLALDLEGKWEGETLRLHAEAAVLTLERNTDWAPPTLATGLVNTEFRPVGKGTRWVAELEIEGPATDGMTIEVRSQAGGPYVLLTEVHADTDAGRRTIVQNIAR